MGDTSQRARSSDMAAQRHQRYRRTGWWPGTSLVSRYEGLVTAAPDSVAVQDDGGASLTRHQLWSEAGRLAGEMAQCGIGSGDVVIVCLPNRVEWQTVFLACLRLGAVPATIPMTTDAPTLRYLCELVGARGVVAPVQHKSRPFGAELVTATRATGTRMDALLIGEHGDEVWKRHQGEQPVVPPIPPGTSHLMFTSSTTGKPKAVAHTEDTLAAVNMGIAERFRVSQSEPIFMASPLGHSVGAWHGARLSLFTGAPLVLQERWDPDRALTLIERERCGFTAAATPLLKDLIEADWSGERVKLASMRTFLCGGAPVPPTLLAEAAIRAPETFVSVLWGMTEGGVTTCLPDDPEERITDTAGVGLPGLEMCTLDAEGKPTEQGVEGELAMRGPGVFVGYLGQDELYQELLTEDGYFRTGDLAEVGADGYVRLTGRLKDLIVRGGVNISPIPAENALSGHPKVRRVALIGVPDERLGERICAVIVAGDDPPDLDEVVTWLRDSDIPRRQWPERLCVLDEMPQTAAGKIRKADLREHVSQEVL